MPRYADEYGISEIFDILKATYLPKSDAPQPSVGTPLSDTVSGDVGISRKYAREDHRHPSDTSRAPINSPAFTGTPTAPTAAAGTSTQQIANTQFVQNALANSGFQHALVPGAHIRIENNVISAYSIGDVDDVHLNGNSCVSHGVAHINDFRGATVADAGRAGLVPAPANWENEKFLCADGTWRSVTGGGSGGGGVNYSKEEQDTGIRWIDGRPIYQITFDLNDYTPESGTVGYTQYLIDVIDLDMSDVIDVEQPGRAYVDGGYVFTSIDGDVRTNYVIGLSSTREVFGVTIYSQSIYSIRYITVRYIKKQYVEYEWDFTQSLTDKNHDITFVGNATRDSLGLHLALGTSITLVDQGEDWTEVDNHYPSFDDWVLELDVDNVTPGVDSPYPNVNSVFNMLGVQYTLLGFVYGVATWQFNTMMALGTVNDNLNVDASYFDGHRLRVRRHDTKLMIYRDSTLVHTHNITNDELVYVGNVLGIGSVAAETDLNYKSLPCTITRCKFSRIL